MVILGNVIGSCSDPALANVLSIIKKFMNILWIIGPILAMIGAVIALVKLLSNPEEKKYKNLLRNMIISLLLLFFIPTIVNVVMKLFDDSFTISACWNYAEQSSSNGQSSSYIEDDDDRPSSSILIDPDAYETGEDSTAKSSGSAISSGTNAKTYVNSINNIKYKLYSQGDPAWGNVKYSSGNTIASVGCMITSIAIVSTAYDTSVTPLTVFNSGYKNNHPRVAINYLTDNYFSCAKGSMDPEEIKNYLRKGYPVVIYVYGKDKGGVNPYTSGQHYMALLDINGDEIFIGTNLDGWAPSSKLLTSIQTVDYCMPTQELLNMYN